MPKSVTHETLRAGQMAMLERFDRHETHFREITTKLFDRAEVAILASHENKVALTEINGKVSALIENRAGHLDRLHDAEKAIRALQDSDTAERAERGVWAAIIRSPFVAWLAALGAVLWAGIKSVGSAATP